MEEKARTSFARQKVRAHRRRWGCALKLQTCLWVHVHPVTPPSRPSSLVFLALRAKSEFHFRAHPHDLHVRPVCKREIRALQIPRASERWMSVAAPGRRRASRG